MIRNLLCYIGLMMMMSLYILSGISNITNPEAGAAVLFGSNFPLMLSKVGITLNRDEYILLVRASGVIFLSLSLFILLGVGRCFFVFLLAVCTAVITVAFHVNLEDPMDTSMENQFHFMKNTAIIGSLLFVSGSCYPGRQYAAARAAVSHSKKSN